jgi:hypothetical protein
LQGSGKLAPDSSLNCEETALPTTNVVNLDALIRRADLAAPGEAAEDITSLSVQGLEPKGFLYPALRKPDFQRETANWSPEQVSDLIQTFARRDLIPAVILWRAGPSVFVIDGAHRLSALIAWVHDDYGDGDVSRRFFQNSLPDEQLRAADRTRELVKLQVGSYKDHKMAIEYPDAARLDIVERASRIGWQEIPAQWIRNADHDKAEKSFFRINQGGTKIDATEQLILRTRRSPTAMAARSVLRAGTGHNYWDKFDNDVQERIEQIGGDIYKLLFDSPLDLPIKTLDLPLAGHGYGPHVLPFLFDLINLSNDVPVSESTHRKSKAIDKGPIPDQDGTKTIAYLTSTRAAVRRINSTHPSSLGLHPALYFCSPTGTFQPIALLSYVAMFKDWSTDDYVNFTRVRSQYEAFLLGNRGITEAVRKLGSGMRSRPRIIALHKKIISGLHAGKTIDQIRDDSAKDPDFSFFVADRLSLSDQDPDRAKRRFTRDTNGAAFLRDALPLAPRCPTCRGIMHRNGMQVGHQRARREGGSADLDNAMMQHPFCNSTVAQ